MNEQCIGVLGGGQLGRMLALEARHLGYQVIQWTGGDCSGAEKLANEALYGAFDDPSALQAFLSQVDGVTVEFENIPRDLVEEISTQKPTYPKTQAVSICQDRELEKSFLREHGIPTADFRIVSSQQELAQALSDIPGDVIIKTARDGYDGKGQLALPLENRPSIQEAWEPFQGVRAIVEQRIQLASEISVMVVRGQDGQVISYDPAENIHQHHILHLSLVPARLPQDTLDRACQLAEQIATALDYVGVMGVEFFIDTDGQLLVNEMAPRPHNSGHHTLDACQTSQFEQQLRATMGLPLGGTALLKPAVMWNLLGDIWDGPDQQPDWSPILSTPGATLHLYGKQVAKAKRKMGHVTITGDTLATALEHAHRLIAHYQA